MNYNFKIKDLKNGQIINSPAKIALWEMIVQRSFGGLDCAMSQYEKYSASDSWLSYKINGMIGYIDELTGGKYGREDKEVTRVASNLSPQFKKRFLAIYNLLYQRGVGNFFYDISAPTNTNDKKSTKELGTIDKVKIHRLLSDFYSENLSNDEIKYFIESIKN